MTLKITDEMEAVLARHRKPSADDAQERKANGHDEPPPVNGPEDYGANIGDFTTSNNAPQRPLIQSSAEFVRGFVPPDYLIDGLLMRRFIYSHTARTGGGKTAELLVIAASVALERAIGKYAVSKGSVLYFAGENPEDVRMRWIAMSQRMDFDIETIDVAFIPGAFKFRDLIERIKKEVEARGDLALVIIDTSAAYFDGTDENDNVQLGDYARRLRTMTYTLRGGPTVIVACHPVKNAAADNLLPRGGGSFLNEMDGNLTSVKDEGSMTAEIHWQGKFRGPDFAPIPFLLKTVTHERLKDTKGRLIPTVVASHLTEAAQEELAAVARGNEMRLLGALVERDGKASQAELARALGWFMKNGEPYKVMVARGLDKLKSHKLIVVEHDDTITITDKGKKALRKDNQPDNGKPENPGG